MTEAPLFPGYEPKPVEDVPRLSAGQRLTLRQGADVAAGIHPLTRGPLHPLASRHRDATAPKDDAFTCGSCWFRTNVLYHGKRYPKCVYDPRRGADDPLDLYVRISHSATTDVRAWWPACPSYSPGDSMSPDAARSIPESVPAFGGGS